MAVYLLDSYGLIFREYFAFISRPLNNKNGENVSALFGFFRNIRSILKVYNPEYMVAAFDSRTLTFRHEKYPEYKANRPKTPEDLHAQVPWIEDTLKALGIKTVRCDGYEADDIIATIATKCSENGVECKIFSGDKDLMQLVNDTTSIMKPSKIGSGWEECNRDGVVSQWGIGPESMLDLLSLTGDSADNVPGVKGVGEKTAVKLLSEYGSLDGIYAHADEIKGAMGNKIRDGKESAYFSQELIKLCTEVPLEELNGENWIDNLKVNANYDAAAKMLYDFGVPAVAKTFETGETKVSDSDEEKSEDKKNVVENKGDYTLCKSVSQLKDFIDEGLKLPDKAFAFDTETDSLDAIHTHLVGFSLSYEKGKGLYVPVIVNNLMDAGDVLPVEDCLKQLERLFNDSCVTVIMHNGKFDYEVLKANGIKFCNENSCDQLSLFGDDESEAVFPSCKIFDTMIAAWLLSADETGKAPYSLESLSEKHLGLKGVEYKDIVGKGQTFADVPLDKAYNYGAEDADFTYQLWCKFKVELEETGLSKLFSEMEMKILPILSEMEIAGIHLDKKSLDDYHIELTEKISQIEQEIYGLVGHEFNIASTRQLQQVLFEELQLKTGKKTKTGYSTDTAVLEELALWHPVPKKILEYRGYTKLKSTYVDALPVLSDKNDRIHTTFLQTGTSTGRLSSKDPNLQNIPIRDEDGRRIRSAFTAEEGKVLISADYAQIELVVMAHLTGDKNLCKAFNEGIDVHKSTAALIYQTDIENVTPEMRRTAKTINFGIIYGMSAFRLSNELGISRSLAKSFIDSYYSQYSGISEFIANTVSQAEENGFVETIFGRRRYIQNINSRNKIEKSAAERVAVNTPIQGSAADIVKSAMIKVQNALINGKYNAKLLLQVHDELILECPENEKDAVMDIVKTEMENAVKLKVPLRVSIECGKNWGEFH